MLQALFSEESDSPFRDDTNNEKAVGRVSNSSYKSIFKGVQPSLRHDTDNENYGYRLFSQECDSLGGDDTNNENYSYRLAAIGYRLFSEEV
jgi:hypothetical protein